MNYAGMDELGLKRKFADPTDVDDGEEIIRGAPRRRYELQNPYSVSVYSPIVATSREVLNSLAGATNDPARIDALNAAVTQPGFGPNFTQRIRNLGATYRAEGRSGRFFEDLSELAEFLNISLGPANAKAYYNLLLTTPAIGTPLGVPAAALAGLKVIGQNELINEYNLSFLKARSRYPVTSELDNFKSQLAGTRGALQSFKPEEYMKSLYVNENYLHSFPQWIGSNIAKAQKKSNEMAENLNLEAKVINVTDPTMRRLMASDPNSVYDNNLGRWTGTTVQSMQNKTLNKAKRLEAQWTKGAALLANSINEAQAREQIPEFINSIVKANANLSETGFGPISSNSSSLYAGRWLDSVTGKMRVLPTANQKYINPAVKEQKLGYLQAKILNHWNECLSSYDEYNKIKNSNKDFTVSAAKSLENSLDMGNTLIQYTNFIYRTLLQQALSPDLPTARGALLRTVNTQMIKAYLTSINAISPLPIKDSVENRQNSRLQEACLLLIGNWERQLTTGEETVTARFAGLTEIERNQSIYKLSRAYLALTSFESRKLRGAFNKLLRMTIPKKISYEYINKGMEDMKTTKSAITELLNEPNQASFTSRNINKIKQTGENLADKVRTGDLPPREAKETIDEMLKLFAPVNRTRAFTNPKYPTMRDISTRAFAVPPVGGMVAEGG